MKKNNFEKLTVKCPPFSAGILYFLGPAGGLFPLPPPDGFPVVLGPKGGLVVDFAIVLFC